MRRLVLPALIVALVGSACLRSVEAPPDVVREYLEALTNGDLGTAYALTDVSRVPPGPGFAVTEDHFVAFYAANPLEAYTITKVTKIEQVVEGVGSRDFFVVDLDLTYGFGSRSESFDVEGTVLPKVRVQLASIILAATPTFPEVIAVDGVSTPVAVGERAVLLTVLGGRHEVVVGDERVVLTTDPIEVVSGPGTVRDGVVHLDG